MVNFLYNSFKATAKYFMKSTSVRASEVLRNLKAGDKVNELPKSIEPYTLAAFETEADLVFWPVESDVHRGGRSYCKSAFVDSALQIEGLLEHHRSFEFYEVLYAEAKCSHLTKRKLWPYNGIRVQVKTDGNVYHLDLVTTTINEMSTFFAYIEDRSKDWVTLELPFHAFQNSDEAYDLQSSGLDEPQIYKLKQIVFGITSPDQTNIEFKAALRRIELIYRADFSCISRGTLPRPVMIKPVPNYHEAKVLDTGAVLLK
mmetsp:Transcript_957/g.2320  ORF Transcript_957/g.2320 Transcript_957/m.2320 type:complete len:258 (+) Transcript_957:650-1423(+)